MTRVLVLDQTRVVIPDEAVEAIEAVDGEASTPWLFELMSEGPALPENISERRALRLSGGGRIAVPASMRIDEVQVLELPPLLRPLAAAAGVIGITELEAGLGLVCDPRLLSPAGERA